MKSLGAQYFKGNSNTFKFQTHFRQIAISYHSNKMHFATKQYPSLYIGVKISNHLLENDILDVSYLCSLVS